MDKNIIVIADDKKGIKRYNTDVNGGGITKNRNNNNNKENP